MARPLNEIAEDVDKLLGESAERAAYQRTPVTIRYLVLDYQRLVKELWDMVKTDSEGPSASGR